MNYGQRQAKLSVAKAAPLRRLAYLFGGQERDKAQPPKWKTFIRVHVEGQDSFLGERGDEISAVGFTFRARPCEAVGPAKVFWVWVRHVVMWGPKIFGAVSVLCCVFILFMRN